MVHAISYLQGISYPSPPLKCSAISSDILSQRQKCKSVLTCPSLGNLFQNRKTDLRGEEMMTEHFLSCRRNCCHTKAANQLGGLMGNASRSHFPSLHTWYYKLVKRLQIHTCKNLEFQGELCAPLLPPSLPGMEGTHCSSVSKQTNKMCFSYATGSYLTASSGYKHWRLRTKHGFENCILLVIPLPIDYYVQSSFMSAI